MQTQTKEKHLIHDNQMYPFLFYEFFFFHIHFIIKYIFFKVFLYFLCLLYIDDYYINFSTLLNYIIEMVICMKNKIIIPTIVSLLVGSYLGYIIFNQYKNNNVENVFNENEKVYFLQQGVYSNIENIEKNTTQISDYIYFKDNEQYRVFVGLTTNNENSKKIKGIFNNKNYDIYIKEINISNRAFIEKLKQYDELISATTDEAVILGIVKQILNEYELVVKSDEEY